MTPIDFVVFDGDSDPNAPVYKVAEALKKPIRIFSLAGEHEVLSYYMTEEGMVLDIQLKPRSKARNKETS